MSVIIFIVIITALVFVHELGHFLAAKKTGMRVDEFAIGFPPKIFSWKKGETIYAINLIPFGGYVKIFGENPGEEVEGGLDSSRSFSSRSKLSQAIVLVAGIVFNILFAWVLFSVALYFGTPTDASSTKDASLVITAVTAGSPAEKAGIVAGDFIKQIDQVNSDISPDVVRSAVSKSFGKPLKVVVSHKGVDEEKIISAEKTSSNDYMIGIQMALISIKKLPIHLAIYEGLKTTYIGFIQTTKDIAKFLSRAIIAKADLSQVAGPVGIVGLVGDASKFGGGYLLSFAALISLNLAVINLIPFPALDGGRLLIVAIEAIIRRSISSKVVTAINAVGFILLIFFMIAITSSDLSKLLHK